MGDPGKILILESVLNVIKEENLLKRVEESGKVLKSGLLQLEKEFPELISAVRGRGTFLAFNSSSPKLQGQILSGLKKKGKIFISFYLSYLFYLLLEVFV